MAWYIMKGSLYVSRPGSVKSYTNDIFSAQKFNTEEEARRNKCDNETAVKEEV